MKSSQRMLIYVMSFSGVLSLSCEEDFSPKAPFEQKLVVFSLLTAARDTQYIRISRSYDVEGLDPFENRESPDVADAQVSVSIDGGSVVTFRDTVIQRESAERYGAAGTAYYAAPFQISPLTTYTLDVSSLKYGNASASFRTPNAIGIAHEVDRVTGDFSVTAVSRGSKGFLIRLFIVFAVIKAGTTEERVVEVPEFISDDGTSVYPDVDRLNSRIFWGDVISTVQNDVIQSDTSAEVSEIGRRIVAWALEPHAYNYYQVSRGFNDPFSVRVDLPDYTNILGGFGVFGGMLVDSVFVRTP